MKKLLIVLLVFTASLTAQNILNTIKQYQNNKTFKNAQWSITAKYVDTGDEIVSYNPQWSLAPASGLKIVTTAAALSLLGENYKYETVLYHSGSIDGNGELNGNLYIIGGGDPTLGSDRVDDAIPLETVIEAWVSAIELYGVNRIDGKIIADDLRYDRFPIPPNWNWIDIGNYYGAQSSALTIHDNLYYLYFAPGKKVGDAAKVLRMDPEVPGLTFKNYMTTGAKGSGDNGYIYNAPNQYNAVLQGTVPMGYVEFDIKGSIPNPPLFAAQYLKQNLEERGIVVTGGTEVTEDTVAYKEDNLIVLHESESVSKVVDVVNGESFNMYAEMLVKEIGYVKKGEGSHAEGIEAVMDFIESLNVSTEGVELYDGSGLSRSNKVTTEMMTNLLIAMTKTNVFDSYYESLPVYENENNAHVKSGYIGNVRSHSGYVEDANGRLIAFSMIANNYTGSSRNVTSAHKKLMKLLAGLK